MYQTLFFSCLEPKKQKEAKKKTPDLRLLTYRFSYSWLASTWYGGHVGGQYNKNYLFSKIYMKMEFSFQRIEIFGSWPPTWLPWRHVQTSNTRQRTLIVIDQS